MAMPGQKNIMKVWRELTFEVAVGAGDVLVGSMDRVIQKQDGACVILDFKITREKKTAQELLDAYHYQMELYTWSLYMLEPEAVMPDRASCFFVNVSTDSVDTVPVPLPGWVFQRPHADHPVSKRLEEVGKILGADIFPSATPTPGKHCVFCRVSACQFNGLTHMERK